LSSKTLPKIYAYALELFWQDTTEDLLEHNILECNVITIEKNTSVEKARCE